MKLRNLKIAIMDDGRRDYEIAQDCDIHYTSFSQILSGRRVMPDRVKKKLEILYPELKD